MVGVTLGEASRGARPGVSSIWAEVNLVGLVVAVGEVGCWEAAPGAGLGGDPGAAQEEDQVASSLGVLQGDLLVTWVA